MIYKKGDIVSVKNKNWLENKFIVVSSYTAMGGDASYIFTHKFYNKFSKDPGIGRVNKDLKTIKLPTLNNLVNLKFLQDE